MPQHIGSVKFPLPLHCEIVVMSLFWILKIKVFRFQISKFVDFKFQNF